MSQETRTYTDAQGQAQPDRRVDHRLRAAFVRAWAVLEPMLHAADGTPSSSTGYALAVALRDELPELTPAERNLLISAAMRIQREHRKPALAVE